MRRVKHTSINRAARAGIPVFPGAFAIGISFGVLARTEHFGGVAAIVMSATTFAGSSQIAAVSLLGGGGALAAAIVAALLLNSRYAPIGVSVARAFRGRSARRFAEAQFVVDESWALGNGDRARWHRSAAGGRLHTAPAHRPDSAVRTRMRLHSSQRRTWSGGALVKLLRSAALISS